jgi:SAM-dependent methyltransferase
MTLSQKVDWQQETWRYDQPHRRLAAMSRLLQNLPQRRILDVGCSTAALRRLLPADFDYYGCDIADHALATLGSDRFRQMDFNRDCDLSPFAGKRIEVVHLGGVLEYLHQPGNLLAGLRKLLPAGGAMILSIINFDAQSYQDRRTHHAGWIYRPSLRELRDLLAEQHWKIGKQHAFIGKPGLRHWSRERTANLLGVDHPWTRRHARQFLLTTTAA